MRHANAAPYTAEFVIHTISELARFQDVLLDEEMVDKSKIAILELLVQLEKDASADLYAKQGRVRVLRTKSEGNGNSEGGVQSLEIERRRRQR